MFGRGCRTHLLETPPLGTSVLKPSFHLKKQSYQCYGTGFGILVSRFVVVNPHLSLAELQRLGELLALSRRQVLLVLDFFSSSFVCSFVKRTCPPLRLLLARGRNGDQNSARGRQTIKVTEQVNMLHLDVMNRCELVSFPPKIKYL